MTFIMTIIRPEGIWQSVDYRLSRSDGSLYDDTTSKQVHYICPPLDRGPHILMAYTGLAILAYGTPTQQWVRETLRGEPMDLITALYHLRDRLNRDVGQSNLWHNRLIFEGGIIDGVHRVHFELSNVNSATFGTTRNFNLHLGELDRPLAFINGGGREGMSISDRDLLVAQLNLRPASWNDHLGLLAAINRRTSRTDPSNSVSPWCHVTYIGPEEVNPRGRIFSEWGEEEPPIEINSIFMGIDSTEIVNARGLSKPELDAAGRRAIERRL